MLDGCFLPWSPLSSLSFALTHFSRKTRTLPEHLETFQIRRFLGSLLTSFWDSQLTVQDNVTICTREKVTNPVHSTGAGAQVSHRVMHFLPLIRSTSANRNDPSRSDPSVLQHIRLARPLLRDTTFQKSHLIDARTGSSPRAILDTREFNQVVQKIELSCVHIHGSPSKSSGDAEFFKRTFENALKPYGMIFEARAAHRHQNTIIV